MHEAVLAGKLQVFAFDHIRELIAFFADPGICIPFPAGETNEDCFSQILPEHDFRGCKRAARDQTCSGDCCGGRA